MDISKSIAYLKRIYPDDGNGVSLSLEDTPVERRLNEELSIFYLFDEGNSFTYLQNRHIIIDDITETELHRIAMENLCSIAKTITITRTDSGLIYFKGSGNFEASLILVDSIWDETLIEYCPNGYVCGLSARDLLATCDADDMENIKWIHTFSNRIKEFDHPITANLYSRNNIGSKWALYDDYEFV